MKNAHYTASAAVQQNEFLMQQIQQEMMRAGGLISFARFMELALYSPGLGYYATDTPKFGRNGDFITASEISPLFAKCIAQQFLPILTALKPADILEWGAGSGIFAKDLLLELERCGTLPARYLILEISTALRQQQEKLFQTCCPHLLTRIQWLDTLPTSGIKGIIFANEVLDALPTHCFRIEKNAIQEGCVEWKDQQFGWRFTQPMTPHLASTLQRVLGHYSLPEGYTSEINLILPTWIASLTQALNQGIILFIDYGYGRAEYYHPDRSCGTLMCYNQHRSHDNPFIYVGLQDITAHVDFTAVAESAEAAELTLQGFTTQAAFLLASGLLDVAQQKQLSAVEQFQQAQAIKKLTLPSQLGEAVKVMGLSKNLDIPLSGFSLYDRRRAL